MQLQPPAGGGTYMPAIFEHAEQTDFHPDVAVIFTDGHTPWGEPPDYPVIWCVTTGQQPPFGHLVRLQDN
jgi:predicted metal-dependent peptidase